MTQPKFVAKPGQVDYTNIRYCPVIDVIPVRDGKILLVQRAADLTFYPSYWHCIAGFLDDGLSIEEKVYEELGEELGWLTKDIIELKRGQIVLTEAPEYNKTYLVVPVLTTVTEAAIRLDWEASQAQWFEPHDLKKLKLLPGFFEIAGQFFPEARQ
jgi:NADH pyrophosphatase NudC (nudix superfamily)